MGAICRENNMAKLEGAVQIHWASGLHIRPATSIVELLQEYKCQIYFKKDGVLYDARSVLQILTMAAQHLEHLKIIANGEDAKAAVGALEKFFLEYDDRMW